MNCKNNKNELNQFITRLKDADKLIIVEGINDKRALEHFGVKKIEVLNKKPLFDIIETISEKNRNVIILTDLDKEGKKLYSKLKRGLTERGVTVDNYFREFLFKNTKLTHIEGLVKYLENSV